MATKPREDLELDPDVYDDPDRDKDEVSPVKGRPPRVERQDEVDT
jgi:hypothetical protein